MQALREHRKGQAEDRLAAGALQQDLGLVFSSAIGTPLDAVNVRGEFRKITEAARLGTGWAPRDLRYTFVSLTAADGVPIEEIDRWPAQPHRDNGACRQAQAAPRSSPQVPR